MYSQEFIPLGARPPAKIVQMNPPQASLKRDRQAVSTPDATKERASRRLKLDLDILECPICAEPFFPPVYQCQNGHTACSLCCKRITKGCPSCSEPIGHIRNLAVENMVESLEIDCKYAPNGCNRVVKYTKIEEHENEACEYRPIECPVPGCDYQYCKIYMPVHLQKAHSAQIVDFSESASFQMKGSDGYVFLRSEKVWLLLHCLTVDRVGAHIYCISFGRPKEVVSSTKEVVYKITVEPVKLDVLERTVVYNMQAVAPDSSSLDNVDYLLAPCKKIETYMRKFDITVMLV